MPQEGGYKVSPMLGSLEGSLERSLGRSRVATRAEQEAYSTVLIDLVSRH